MKKVYGKLTQDQIDRGVVFSSQLKPGAKVHEIFRTESPEEQKRRKALLLDDSFFDGEGSPYTHNSIKQ